MHNGLMKMGAAKMAGSVGNVVNVVDLLKKIPADTLRFFLLNTHYRSPIDFGEEAIASVERGLDSFYRYFDRYERVTGESFYTITAPTTAAEHAAQLGSDPLAVGETARHEFLQLMADDFNTGGAIGPLFNLVKELNRLIDEHKLEAGRTADNAAGLAQLKCGTLVLKELTQILGVFLAAPAKAEMAADSAIVAGLMELILAVRADVRTEAKASKNKALFAVSDRIRDGLAGLGIVVEDRSDGSSWTIKK
jgi:cysteinyl-tRNA synthetase